MSLLTYTVVFVRIHYSSDRSKQFTIDSSHNHFVYGIFTTITASNCVSLKRCKSREEKCVSESNILRPIDYFSNTVNFVSFERAMFANYSLK